MTFAGYRLFNHVAAMLVVIVTPFASHSQRLITLDGDKCGNDIAALATLTGSDVQPANPPRRMPRRCQAQDVVISQARINVKINQLQWQTGGLSNILAGDIPEGFTLNAQGIRINQAPENDPIWGFLQTQSMIDDGLQVTIGFSYRPQDQSLDLTDLAVTFPGGGENKRSRPHTLAKRTDS